MTSTRTRSIPFTGKSQNLNSKVETVPKMFRGSSSSTIDHRLEEMIDIDKEIEIYDYKRLNTLNPKQLYKSKILDFKTKLIKRYRETALSVTEPIDIPLIHAQTIEEINKTGLLLFHLGLVCIGIKGLSRRELGTKILVGIMDKSWTNDASKALIVAAEVDMSDNLVIFYVVPQITKIVKDLPKLQIILQSKGYESYVGDNIILTVAVLGKATNSSGHGYKLKIDGIIDFIASKGIKMIKPMKIDPKKLAGQEWNLQKHMENDRSVITPGDAIMYRNQGGSQSHRFINHTTTTNREEEEETAESE